MLVFINKKFNWLSILQTQTYITYRYNDLVIVIISTLIVFANKLGLEHIDCLYYSIFIFSSFWFWFNCAWNILIVLVTILILIVLVIYLCLEHTDCLYSKLRFIIYQFIIFLSVYVYINSVFNIQFLLFYFILNLI